MPNPRVQGPLAPGALLSYLARDPGGPQYKERPICPGYQANGPALCINKRTFGGPTFCALSEERRLSSNCRENLHNGLDDIDLSNLIVISKLHEEKNMVNLHFGSRDSARKLASRVYDFHMTNL